MLAPGPGPGPGPRDASPRAEAKRESPKKQAALAAPSAKGVDNRGGGRGVEREEEDFADDDVNDLLV